MSAICSPARVTPSIWEPVWMMVAAWVSWAVFSVKVCPSAVVTSSESGTGPTTPGPEALVVVQEALAPGLNIIPTPSRSRAGLNSTSTAAITASFFTTRSPQRVAQLRQAQQMAGVVGRRADHEHRELHLVGRGDRFAVPGPGAVPGALDGVGDRARCELSLGRPGQGFAPRVR